MTNTESFESSQIKNTEQPKQSFRSMLENVFSLSDPHELFTQSKNLSKTGKEFSEALYENLMEATGNDYKSSLTLLKNEERELKRTSTDPEKTEERLKFIRSLRGKVVYNAHLSWAVDYYGADADPKSREHDDFLEDLGYAKNESVYSLFARYKQFLSEEQLNNFDIYAEASKIEYEKKLEQQNKELEKEINSIIEDDLKDDSLIEKVKNGFSVIKQGLKSITDSIHENRKKIAYGAFATATIASLGTGITMGIKQLFQSGKLEQNALDKYDNRPMVQELTRAVETKEAEIGIGRDDVVEGELIETISPYEHTVNRAVELETKVPFSQDYLEKSDTTPIPQSTGNPEILNKSTEEAPNAEPLSVVLETRVPEEFRGFADSPVVTPEGSRRWKQQEWLPISKEFMPVYDLTNPSVENYTAVVEYFNVADPENRRYSATKEYTFCNIFVGDVTSALGVPIPRYIEGSKTNANFINDWLKDPERGGSLGWQAVTPEEAQEYANKGIPAIASVKWNGHPGHLAMIVPGTGEVVDGNFFPNSAQAGRINFIGQSTHYGFERWIKNTNSLPEYFVNTSTGYTFVAPEEARKNNLAVSILNNYEAIEKVSDTGDAETVIRFSDNYKELSNENKEIAFVKPEEIVLHWDGNTSSPENWTVEQTYNGLSGLREDKETGKLRSSDAHFAVDARGVLQMLETREDEVRRSYGSYGYPDVLNIEMAGANFSVDENGITNVPESEIENTINLVIRLIVQYNLQYENVVGHYERDLSFVNGQEIDRGKPDPGYEFLNYFKKRLANRLDELGMDVGQP